MLSFYVLLERLFISFILGGLVGWERETHGRVAGLRTHILVCLGANLFMLVSQYIFFLYKDSAAVDPGRIAAQIITGIGFIGAGTVMQSKFSIRGLTTAASLWVVAGIGMAVGCGFYAAALITVLFALITLLFLWRVERFFPRDWYKTISICGIDKEGQFEKIKKMLKDYDAEIQNCVVERDKKEGKIFIEMNVKCKGMKFRDEFIEKLTKLEEVEKVKWE